MASGVVPLKVAREILGGLLTGQAELLDDLLARS